MKAVIVMSSELTKAGRMDAGFFVTLDQYKEQIEQVKAKHSEEEAAEILTHVDLKHPALCDILNLSRGSVTVSDSIKRAAKEYPIEVLAIILGNGEELLEGVALQARKAQEKATLLNKIL